MKKIFLLPLLLLSIPACSKTQEFVTITTIYMELDEKNELVPSEYDFKCSFAFEKNYVLTDLDVYIIGNSSCIYVEVNLETLNNWYYYDVSDLYFDLESKESLKPGYIVQEDIVLYYGYTKINPSDTF